jgi:hypothetical protein
MGDELDGVRSWWDKYINDVTPIEWFPFPFFTMRHLLFFDTQLPKTMVTLRGCVNFHFPF